jgi:hypothetical protein
VIVIRKFEPSAPFTVASFIAGSSFTAPKFARENVVMVKEDMGALSILACVPSGAAATSGFVVLRTGAPVPEAFVFHDFSAPHAVPLCVENVTFVIVTAGLNANVHVTFPPVPVTPAVGLDSLLILYAASISPYTTIVFPPRCRLERPRRDALREVLRDTLRLVLFLNFATLDGIILSTHK